MKHDNQKYIPLKDDSQVDPRQNNRSSLRPVPARAQPTHPIYGIVTLSCR